MGKQLTQDGSGTRAVVMVLTQDQHLGSSWSLETGHIWNVLVESRAEGKASVHSQAAYGIT